MRTRIFGVLLGTFAMTVHAQPMDLKGRVVQRNGAPVPDALVELETRGVATKTAADGSFVLNGNSSLRPDVSPSFGYRLEPGFLVVDAQRALDMRVEVVDGAGRMQGGMARRLEAGHHRISLSEAMPAPSLGAELYFLNLDIGGRTLTHLLLYAGKGAAGAVFGPAYRRSAAAKLAAAVDSLRVRKAGYKELVLAVASYTAGSLGDLVLSADQDGGGLCARQRAERTSDGFEVVVCEALYDQPPRVRLPAVSASYAYAGMTRDAFITTVGETYPHASSSVLEPEMRRHASALYEIKLLNGKVKSFRPAIVFAESLFMAPLMGKAFEGLISRRTGAARYELIPSLPIRVQILAEPFRGGPEIASAFPVKTAIVNRTMPVTAADGTCMPAFSSYGSQAPFDPGTDIPFTVGRHPSMHTFGDNELVFYLQQGGSLMSTEWFFMPLDLVKNTLTLSGTYSGVGHSAPGAVPMLDLDFVSGGGGACSPK